MYHKTYKLSHQPYIDGEFYSAHANDKMGNEYMIHWEIKVDDIENLEDESEACDWDHPLFITKL